MPPQTYYTTTEIKAIQINGPEDVTGQLNDYIRCDMSGFRIYHNGDNIRAPYGSFVIIEPSLAVLSEDEFRARFRTQRNLHTPINVTFTGYKNIKWSEPPADSLERGREKTYRIVVSDLAPHWRAEVPSGRSIEIGFAGRPGIPHNREEPHVAGVGLILIDGITDKQMDHIMSHVDAIALRSTYAAMDRGPIMKGGFEHVREAIRRAIVNPKSGLSLENRGENTGDGTSDDEGVEPGEESLQSRR